MNNNPQAAAREVYALLMNEVRLRSEAVHHAISGKTGLASWLAQEFAYLQLRLICETISLGCLIAHGEIEATKTNKLQTEWAADKILNRLGKLHADFYPHPHTMKQLGPGRFHLDWVREGFMTRAELVSTWHKCAGLLHRGTAKSLLKPENDFPYSFADIDQSMRKIATLLKVHRLALFDGKTQFLCIMKNDAGNVQVAITKAIPLSEAPPASPPPPPTPA